MAIGIRSKIPVLGMASCLTVLLCTCNSSDKSILSSAKAKLDSAQYQEAIATLETMKRKSQSAEALLLQGVAQVELGYYNAAIQSFSASINLDNKNYKTFYNRGLARMFAKEHTSALEDFNVALKLNSKVQDIYLNRGNLLFQMNRFGEAISDFEQVLSYNKEDRTALYNLGYMYQNTGNPQKAKQYFGQYLSRDSTNARVLHGYGLALAQTKPNDDACYFLHKSLQAGYASAIKSIRVYCDKAPQTIIK